MKYLLAFFFGAFITSALAIASIAFGHQTEDNEHASVLVPHPFYTVTGNCKCDWYHVDINHDGTYNVGDTGILMGMIADANTPGVKPPTYTSTPTATNTATPTNTPTPSGFSKSALINDSDESCSGGGTTDDGDTCIGSPNYPNQGSLCDPPASWNWGKSGHGLTGAGPTGTLVTGWWTSQWNGCGDSASGVTITITDYHFVGWTGSAWIDMGGEWDDWDICHIFDPRTIDTDYGTCSTNPPTMATGQRSLHGSTDQQADQNVQCLAVYYFAKSAGSKDIMANAGADHWADSSTYTGDLFISRYKLLNTSTFTQVGGTSCTASLINSNPPPDAS